MRTLTFADGTSHACETCGAANGVLCVTLPGISVTDAIVLLVNPQKTRRMHCDYGSGVEQDFEGYTQFAYALYNAADGTVTVGLRAAPLGQEVSDHA